jgi:hypothetical protein
MNANRRSRWATYAVVVSGALVLTACTASTADPQRRFTPLYDPTTTEQIGVKDSTSGDYLFSNGDRIETSEIQSRFLSASEVSPELREVSRRIAASHPAVEGLSPEEDFSSDKNSLERHPHHHESCWYMAEGSVGCMGCCTMHADNSFDVWEYCWDG